MDPFSWVLAVLAAPFGVYVIFRLIFAAWFKAKQQYEDYKYGTKQRQPRTGP